MRKRNIYYGPPGRETSMSWLVSLSRAKKPVILEGPLKQGRAGTNIGCGISQLAGEQPQAFGYPVYLVSVTATGLIAVDKLDKRGQPSHGQLYTHKYGWFVKANDERSVNKIKQENPTAFEGPFTFDPSRKRGGVSTGGGGGHESDPKARVPRGCLRRAQNAGLIDPLAMKQIVKAL